MHKFAFTASVAALSLAASAAHATGDWAGFHVDGHVDVGWMTSNWHGFDGAEGFFPPPPSGVTALAEPSFIDEEVVRFHVKNEDTGWGGGVGLGYNWQFDNVVLGAIVDWTWLHASDSKTFEGAEGGSVRLSTDINSVGTLRAILGFAGDKVMPYVTAGWAWGDVNRHLRSIHPPPWDDGISFALDADGGWTAGGGVSFAVGPNTNINAEVLYIDFGSDSKHVVHPHTDGLGIEDAARVTTHMTLARLGVQFRF